MNINLISVALATIAQFIIGALWYSLLFGKLWGQIHGFDKPSPEVQKEMAGKMGPFYGLQLLVTIINTIVLAMLIKYLPNLSPYYLAFLLWIGFIVPTQVSDIIFGGTEGKWIAQKLAVLSAASLVCIMVAAGILSVF